MFHKAPFRPFRVLASAFRDASRTEEPKSKRSYLAQRSLAGARMPASRRFRADLLDDAWYVGFRVTGIAAVRIFADLLQRFARLLSVIGTERFAEEFAHRATVAL